MDEWFIVVPLLAAVSATSFGVIAQFLTKRVFKKAHKDLAEYRAQLDELQAENSAIGRDIEGFKTKLITINYGAVTVSINGPEVPAESEQELAEAVVETVKKFIPEAHIAGDAS